MMNRCGLPAMASTIWLATTMCLCVSAQAEPPAGELPVETASQATPIAESTTSNPVEVDEPQTGATASSTEVIAPIERTPLGGAVPADETDVAEQPVDMATPTSLLTDAVRTGGALFVVIGLILVVRMILRRVGVAQVGLMGQLGAGGRAPSGVLAILGRYPVGRGQSIVLLQAGVRVLVLSQTSSGFRTLSEITDPEEVAQLLLKTRDEEGQSMSERFRSLLRGASQDPSIVGEDEDDQPGGPVSMRIAGGLGDVGVSLPDVDESDDEDGLPLDGVQSLRQRLAAMAEPDS